MISTHCDSAKGAGHTPYQSIANNYWVGGTRGALNADRPKPMGGRGVGLRNQLNY